MHVTEGVGLVGTATGGGQDPNTWLEPVADQQYQAAYEPTGMSDRRVMAPGR